ncbi:MAG: glycosyltransferase involved in cell wall biosynthesis [Parvicella sp.]|jgi:glycosyltransferase involved in cell wall biosynthesis
MKICQVISGYYRNDPRVFQRQSKSLVQAGFEVSILTNDGGASEVLDGIPIHTTRVFYKKRIKVLLFGKTQFIRDAIRLDADAYIIHSPELLSLGVSLRRIGKIVVYDAHEDLPRHILEKDWLPKYIRRPIATIVEVYMSWALKKFHEVISPHNHVVERILKINPNTTLITNFAKVQESRLLDQSDYFDRPKRLCYSGTVYFHSNQETILTAISAIDGVEYKIAGFLDDEFNKKLSMIDGYEKLEFIGRLPWNELNSFYNKCVIGLVIIDYKKNLGGKNGTFAVNKMFEYMAAGIPIICSDYALWENVINKHGCGICVQPGDVKSLRTAIRVLLEDQKMAYEMGQNGIKAVLQEYNWATQEKKLIEIFRRYTK